MAYCTPDELAAALRITVTGANTAQLTSCIDAAATEIDHALARTEPLPDGDALANRVNVVRAVEWWKANDAAFGVLGFDQIGALQVPRNGFRRHAAALVPLKQAWGIA